MGGLQCLQFRTDQAQDLKRLEKLNQLFFALTVHGETVELGSSPHRHLLCVYAALSTSCEGARQPSRVGSEAAWAARRAALCFPASPLPGALQCWVAKDVTEG